jgi:hypothetical protein
MGCGLNVGKLPLLHGALVSMSNWVEHPHCVPNSAPCQVKAAAFAFAGLFEEPWQEREPSA